MPTLRTRASKGSALTHNELDANFKRPVQQKTTTYSCVVGDNRSVIECNSATPFTVTLGDANTMDAAETGDYEITIANIGSGAVTVARAGSDTIDGGSTSLTLNQYTSVTLKVNSAGNGYTTIASGSLNADINVIRGGAAAGVTSTKFQYLATPTGSLYYSGGTDVPVTDGGTGASTAAGARTNLGIGTLGTLNSLVETSIDWSGCAAIGFGTFHSYYSLSVSTSPANMAAQGNDPTFLVYVPESATTMTYGFYCSANTTGGTISIRLNHATPGNGTAISFASTSTLAWRSSGAITVSALSGVTSFNLQSYCSTSSDTVNVFALWYYFT